MEEAPAEAAAAHGIGHGALGLLETATRKGRLPPRRPAPLLEAGTAQRRHIIPSVCRMRGGCVVLDGSRSKSELFGTSSHLDLAMARAWRRGDIINQSNVRAGAIYTHHLCLPSAAAQNRN